MSDSISEAVLERAEGGLVPAGDAAPARLLPGETRPHPTPRQYVMIAAILVVITAIEIGVSYLGGDIPNGLIVTLLLVMALTKFVLVASWFMHLRTDKPVFRRFFTVGVCGAVLLFLVVLTTLHVFQ